MGCRAELHGFWDSTLCCSNVSPPQANLPLEDGERGSAFHFLKLFSGIPGTPRIIIYKSNLHRFTLHISFVKSVLEGKCARNPVLVVLAALL